MQKRMKLSLLILNMIALIFAMAGCSSPAKGDTKGISVKAITADKHKLQISTGVSGVLVPGQTVNIAAKTMGQVKSISVGVGSMVKAGDNVITLQTKELDAQLQQAQAVLSSVSNQASQAKVNMDAAEKALAATRQLIADQEFQAKVNVDAAQKTLDRTKLLCDAGAVSRVELENAQNKYDLAKKQYDMVKADSGSSAQSQIVAAQSRYDLAKSQYENASGAALLQAQASVNSIKVQSDNAIISSPINGIIVNKNINQGEIASVGATMLTVADTSTLKLKGTVSQEVMPLLKLGQDINVSVDIYPDKVFKGKIESLGPMSVSTGQYFPIEISIANPDDIKAGLSAHASFDMNTDEQVIVPVSAVAQNNGESYVFVIKNNLASKRIVTLGRKSDSEVEVLKGLEPGEKVATQNVNNLFDNMQVDTE